jgi:hypothetical protein
MTRYIPPAQDQSPPEVSVNNDPDVDARVLDEEADKRSQDPNSSPNKTEPGRGRTCHGLCLGTWRESLKLYAKLFFRIGGRSNDVCLSNHFSLIFWSLLLLCVSLCTMNVSEKYANNIFD